MIEHPYTNLAGGSWLRGNLHMHTTASDGARELSAAVGAYRARGYDFLMISDHDYFSDTPRLAAESRDGMTLIPGNEISANGPHLLHVNAGRLVPPDANRQVVLDGIGADQGFAVMNHPNWQKRFSHCPQELLDSLTGYIGIEIFNGVIHRLDGSAFATDRWDMLLADGRRIWGFANDDSHALVGDDALGWNMVYAADRSVDAIVDAMASGCFYASTGVTFSQIAVNGDEIRIVAPNADRIVAVRDIGRRVATVDGQELVIRPPAGAKYLRFEAYGAGEAVAWTQPFWLS